MKRSIPLLTALALATGLSACGGGADSPPPPAPSITVAAPVTQAAAGGKPATISASVSPAASIAWQLAAGAPGTLTGNGNSAVYTPPPSVASNTQVTITAAAGSTMRTVSLTLYPAPGAPGLSLVAGHPGGRGLVDGRGSDARFGGLTAASANGGALLLGDASDQRRAIRQLAADCSVTTLLDTEAGAVDGPAQTARIGRVAALAAATDGSIWFVDRGADDPRAAQLRVMATDKSVRTIPSGSDLYQEGSGRVPTASGNASMVRGQDDAMYIARDSFIARATQDGTVAVFAGRRTPPQFDVSDGVGSAASFAGIMDLAVLPNGDLLVLDGRRLRRVTPAAEVSTVLEAEALVWANAISVRNDGAIVLSVHKATTFASTEQVLVWNGDQLAPLMETSEALPLDFDAHLPWRQLVRDNGAGTLLLNAGTVRTLAGSTLQPCAGLDYAPAASLEGNGASVRFNRPQALASDRIGNVFVHEQPAGTVSGGLQVRKISPAGASSTVALERRFAAAAGMTADSANNIYLVERAASDATPGGALWRLAPDGNLSVLAGQAMYAATGQRSIADGQGGAARFVFPALAGIDSSDNLYLSDLDGARTVYRKVSPAGVVRTVDRLPADIGLAPDGQRYLAEGHAVYRVAADGSRTVVAGRPGVRGTRLGALPGGLDQPVIAPAGPSVFYVISGQALLRLAVPQ